MRIHRLALLSFIICFSIQLSPVQSVNIFALSQAMDGSTQDNEDEWNTGLKSIYSGDFAAAFEHWTISAAPGQNGEKGYYLAQIGLSILFENGVGVRVDKSEAARWMSLGWEERTSATSQERMANIYIGLIYGMLGRAYEDGKGVSRNLEQARFAYSMGASYQNAESAFRIGVMMESGAGAASWDYSGAVGYFTQAAKAGHSKAQFSLATMYLDGRGVAQDYKRAYVWYSLSAANLQKTDDFDPVRKRNELGEMMSPDQLASSQELAQQCILSEYAECN